MPIECTANTLSIEGNGSPTIEVAIPFCERDTYLRDAIDSVIDAVRQCGRTDIAVTVFDNASVNRNAAEIAASYGPGVVRYHRFEERVAMFANWNRCIRSCSARWVHLMHDDDILEPGFYRQFFQYLREGKTFDLYACAHFFADSLGTPSRYKKLDWTSDRAIDDPLQYCLVSNPIATAGAILRLQKVEEMGGFPEDMQFAGDWYFYIKLAAHSQWIGTWRPLLRYREHGESATNAIRRNVVKVSENLRCVDLAVDLLAQERETGGSLAYGGKAALWIKAVVGWFLLRCQLLSWRELLRIFTCIPFYICTCLALVFDRTKKKDVVVHSTDFPIGK